MELGRAQLGDVPMIVVAGTIDDGACGILRAELDRLFEARYNVIFLDFTDVDEIEGSGLSVLHAGVQALGKRGWLGLIGLNQGVNDLLGADGLLASPRIRVFLDRQAARVATGERAST